MAVNAANYSKDNARNLRCRECGRIYPVSPTHVCEFCFGPLEVVYDYESLKSKVTRETIARGPKSLWRYQDLLPVDASCAQHLPVGFTPLVKADLLAKEFGLKNLYLKNDSVNYPTFSFKDRVVAVALAKAKEFGFKTIACASTGNLACAVAAQAAQAGMECYVFVPSNLELGKVVNMAVYGPNVVFVDGSYDDVNRLCSELADQKDWAFVNVNIRPFYAEGSKTLGFETVEQLGWCAPDHAVVPIASGSLLTKIWKGIKEFETLGLITSANTKISGAQALGCSPVATAYKNNTFDVQPVKPNTIAKSLAIGNPADGYYALKTITSTGGTVDAVSDDEIVQGIHLLAQTEGIFTETAGGVTVAVLRKLALNGFIKPEEITVAYITGNGLKTIDAVEDSLTPPLRISPSVKSFEELLQKGCN